MKDSFEQIPADNQARDPEKIKERLRKSSERLAEVEEKIMEKHVKNLIFEVYPSQKLNDETLNILLKEREVMELINEIFRLEHQSQTTIEEGGYTNKEKAELLRGQLASLIERKLPEIEKAA